MADAKKCDVCGKYYDKYYTDTCDYTKPNTIILTNEYNKNVNKSTFVVKELCLDCMNSINEHLEYLSSVSYNMSR